ncbi:MAG: ATP-grasp fold amidoligase family protein [Aeromicrobium sp.]
MAWRDAKIRSLAADLSHIEKDLAAQRSGERDLPSFARYVYADRRINALLGERNIPGRCNQIARKLKAYSFAQSHGVRIPELLGLWERPEDIPWDDLPNHVVLKSHTGAASRGVYPLRRIDGRWVVVTRDEPIEAAEITAQLTKLLRDGQIGGPLFGQQLIGAGRDNALPTEVRVFGFYGEVGMVNVRRATSHGDNAGTRVRRFLEDGTPGPRHPLHDDAIGLPDIFEAVVDIGRRFSTQVPRPFVRIDFLDDDGDVVFGELTPRPGGPHYFGPADDLRLGEVWERAQARVLNDVIDGSDYSLKFGPGPRELTIGDRQYMPDQGWLEP